jgi:hypothetical protein
VLTDLGGCASSKRKIQMSRRGLGRLANGSGYAAV